MCSNRRTLESSRMNIHRRLLSHPEQSGIGNLWKVMEHEAGIHILIHIIRFTDTLVICHRARSHRCTPSSRSKSEHGLHTANRCETSKVPSCCHGFALAHIFYFHSPPRTICRVTAAVCEHCCRLSLDVVNRKVTVTENQHLESTWPIFEVKLEIFYIGSKRAMRSSIWRAPTLANMLAPMMTVKHRVVNQQNAWIPVIARPRISAGACQ